MAESLAAQAGVLAERPLELPAVFSAPQAPIVARKLSPYITFAHNKRADEWAKLTAKCGGPPTEGDMYFIHGDDMRHLDTAKLGWITGYQYWAEIQQPKGEILRASEVEQPRPFKELIEAVVLCYLDDKVVPCNVLFRTTKCPGAKQLSDALIACQTPDWPKLSGAHEATLVIGQPFCRFFGELRLQAPRGSKTSGYTYRTTTASIKPTGIAEWKLLEQLQKDPECMDLMQHAARRFEDQVATVKAKLVK